MWAALEAAQIRDLVEGLPDGLETVVGERGYRLSGGERQRLAIARLLLKAPPIVVLDEATAHLDSESEAAVQRALDTAMQGRTSIVIAHRLSTIRDADLILVVDHGRIVQRGRHKELLAEGGLYADSPHPVRPAGSRSPRGGGPPGAGGVGLRLTQVETVTATVAGAGSGSPRTRSVRSAPDRWKRVRPHRHQVDHRQYPPPPGTAPASPPSPGCRRAAVGRWPAG